MTWSIATVMYENEIIMCSIVIACDAGIVAYHKSFQHKG